MDGVDRGLELICAGLVAAKAAADDCETLVDHRLIPLPAVLVAEQRERAVGPDSRPATGLSQEQQRQQAVDLLLVRHRRRHDPRQPDRLCAEARSGRAGQPGIVDEVQDGEHRPQTIRQLVILGHAVRDSRRLDLVLGTHETLRHRRFGYEERSCDLLGRQAAEQPERECHLRFGGERRVAAGKDQSKPVVLHGSFLFRQQLVEAVEVDLRVLNREPVSPGFGDDKLPRAGGIPTQMTAQRRHERLDRRGGVIRQVLAPEHFGDPVNGHRAAASR